MRYDPPAARGRPPLNSTRRGAVTLSAALALAGLAAILLLPRIYTLMSIFMPVCLMARLGLRCPLCGGTRCAVCLAHLDIASAFYYNPLVVLCAAVVAYLYLRLVLSCFGREYKPFRPTVSSTAMWWLLGGFLAYFVVRNLPFYRAILY